MTGHRKWIETWAEHQMRNPEFAEAYVRAKRELDESWEVPCRYGRCICYVHPVKGDNGGVGDPSCPCERNVPYCPDDE